MAPPVEQADNPPETYVDRSSVGNGMSAAATTGFAGLLVSAVQNSTQSHKQGALGVFTRTGSTIALFAAMGGIFSFTDSFVANTRRKNDALNGAAGGCAAGLVVGASARSIPMMVGSCAAMATLIGTFDAAGKSLSGAYSESQPLFGVKAAQQGAALEGEGPDSEHAGHGERGWREERERRRVQFFKPRKTADAESE